MSVFHRGSACSWVFVLTCIIGTANADPCGMVPPIYVGPGVPIARIGDQNTFVFYKNGVETVIIHPGFKGKVEQFGMLIPFPAVPELRKVSDSIFPHIRAAIDPPEVIVYAYQRGVGFGGGRFRNAKNKDARPGAFKLAVKKDTVPLLRCAIALFARNPLTSATAAAVPKSRRAGRQPPAMCVPSDR